MEVDKSKPEESKRTMEGEKSKPEESKRIIVIGIDDSHYSEYAFDCTYNLHFNS